MLIQSAQVDCMIARADSHTDSHTVDRGDASTRARARVTFQYRIQFITSTTGTTSEAACLRNGMSHFPRNVGFETEVLTRLDLAKTG